MMYLRFNSSAFNGSYGLVLHMCRVGERFGHGTSVDMCGEMCT